MYAYSHLEDRVVKIQGLCAWTEWSTFHNITNYVARVKINVCTTVRTYIYLYARNYLRIVCTRYCIRLTIPVLRNTKQAICQTTCFGP